MDIDIHWCDVVEGENLSREGGDICNWGRRRAEDVSVPGGSISNTNSYSSLYQTSLLEMYRVNVAEVQNYENDFQSRCAAHGIHRQDLYESV